MNEIPIFLLGVISNTNLIYTRDTDDGDLQNVDIIVWVEWQHNHTITYIYIALILLMKMNSVANSDLDIFFVGPVRIS